AYFFWLLYVSGRLCLLRLYRAAPAHDISRPERVALNFFVGAALWTLVMLPLGYLGLYTRTVALIVTVPIIAGSSGHMLTAVRTIAAHRPTWRALCDMRTVLAAVAVVFALLLLMVKGLYPAGGHDYFTHYFYYYMAVLDHHNIWPNEV